MTTALGRPSGPRGVYAKTLRDSRPALAVVGGFFVLHAWGGAQGMAAYGTADARRQIADFAAAVPDALRGLYGNPLGIDSLGGFLAWQFGGYLAMIVGLWSILALSGTLAGDVRRGSLEIVAASPISRRRIAAEKVAAHLTSILAAAGILALALLPISRLPGLLPRDAIAPAAALGFAAGIAALGLVAGAAAFALAPFVGQRAAAGIAGGGLLGAYLVHGYAPSVPAFGVVAWLSPFAWTGGHLPLSGASDWAAVALVLALAAALLAVGVEAFARRDVGPGSARLPSPPDRLLGLRGPLGRSFAEGLPLSLGWGIGTAAFGFVMASASVQFADRVRGSPDITGLARRLFPELDISTPAGLLQVVFVEFGFVLAGLAAAALVAVWAADETERRQDVLLATPVGRVGWILAGTAGTFGGVALVSAILAASIGLGGAAAGGDVVTPTVGVVSFALFGLAVAGVGLAVGGVLRAAWAAPAAATLAVGTFMLDVLAEPLRLPDPVHELMRLVHMGRPMVGAWDAGGVALCLALALGGVAVAARGIRRRDLGR